MGVSSLRKHEQLSQGANCQMDRDSTHVEKVPDEVEYDHAEKVMGALGGCEAQTKGFHQFGAESEGPCARKIQHWNHQLYVSKVDWQQLNQCRTGMVPCKKQA
jgi:hypothetical protein